MNTSHENIYYLDPWFIAREYEMRSGVSLPSKIRRTSDRSGEGSFGFVKGRVGSQESLEFDQSPEKLFWDILPQLQEFPEVEIASKMALPSVFWVSGMLAPYGQKHTSQTSGMPEVLIDNVWAFSIKPRSADSLTFRLLTDNAYFRYNIQQLLEHPTTLGSHFRPQVRALLKSHGNLGNNGCYLATPLVIIETRGDQDYTPPIEAGKIATTSTTCSSLTPSQD